MRQFIIGAMLALAIIPAAAAKQISLSEWLALGQQNKAAVAAQETANIAAAQANLNPWGTPAGIAYMQAHPYDHCDLVAGKNGFVLPGWAFPMCDPASGGSAANGL